MTSETDHELHAIRASLPIALLRAREALMGPIRDMLAASGITEQQWRVLRVLQEFGKMEGARLAERACLLPPSLSRIVAGMERRGLVQRTMHSKDRRRHILSLTSEGDALLTQNAARAREIADQTRQRLGAEKIDDLLALLAEVSALKGKN